MTTRTRLFILVPLAVCFAAFAGYVDLHNDEVQPAVLVILLSAGLLSLLDPKRAWLWGFLLGISVFVTYAVGARLGYYPDEPPSPNDFATLIALIPAYIGAGGGWLVARFLFRRKTSV